MAAGLAGHPDHSAKPAPLLQDSVTVTTDDSPHVASRVRRDQLPVGTCGADGSLPVARWSPEVGPVPITMLLRTVARPGLCSGGKVSALCDGQRWRASRRAGRASGHCSTEGTTPPPNSWAAPPTAPKVFGLRRSSTRTCQPSRDHHRASCARPAVALRLQRHGHLLALRRAAATAHPNGNPFCRWPESR